MRLNDRVIASLPSPTNGQKMYADDAVTGFGVRVGTRAKTFVLVVGTERRRITLGHYPIVSLAQAREKARIILAQRQLGIDDTPPPSPLFREQFASYVAERERRVRYSTHQKDGYIGKLFDRFNDRRLADITPTMMQALLDEQCSSWTRHYCLRMFVGFVRYQQKRGYMDEWPLNRLDAPLQSIPRERVLTEDELRKVLATARVWAQAGHQFGVICELLILTGQRRQQIGSLCRSEVDFDTNTLNWPADRMKSKRRHVIPMGQRVRDLLKSRMTNGLYFPNQYGSPFSGWSVWYKRFTKDVGFDDFVLHDLRRTLATNWQRMRIDIATTEKMLAHSTVTGGLVGIYQRYSYLEEMKSAVDKWENYIHTLLSTTEGTRCLTPISPTSSFASASG